MTPKKKILLLHTELATYFLACVHSLLDSYNAEIHLVRLPINPEAPFEFDIDERIHVYERNHFTNAQLVRLCSGLKPDLIVCTGWTDKAYLKICKQLFNSIPTVLTLDNHWQGKRRQRLASILSPAFITNTFSHIWVPGFHQYEYAKRLGFPMERVVTGMYSADTAQYFGYYEEYRSAKEHSFPHRLLYLGRYIDIKGIQELWSAFLELKIELANDWELWCAGTGALETSFPNHTSIRNFGFVQPENLGKLIRDTGVFVLPSHYEPWGVVVHELAASGMPLICSQQVGAASHFLVDGYNGYTFPAANQSCLKDTLRQVFETEDSQLREMGDRSVDFAKTITPYIWATKLYRLITTFQQGAL